VTPRDAAARRPRIDATTAAAQGVRHENGERTAFFYQRY
jgi:hypothetical protein